VNAPAERGQLTDDLPAVETLGLRKRYGGVVAVDGVDLTIAPGEIVGLLGPNGAGKTTIIKMLLGLAKPTEGRAAVFGHLLPQEAHRVRQLVGYVTQEVALDRVLSARENLRLVAALYHVPGPRVEERIRGLLDFAELTDRADDVVRTYSGGMRKRLELVMGLVHEPRLLVLDEPTLGLDIQTRRRLWAYVKDLRENHDMTILLTTHYLEEADQLCDRVAIIDYGRIVALDTPAKLKAKIGGDVVRLELGPERGGHQTQNGTAASVALRAAEVVRALGAGEAVAADGEVRATVEGAESALPILLQALRAEGLEVARVSYARPSLDDVFLYYTGRAFREEDAAHRAEGW
jgi:ABC-2 type transport system ATP-binding protein